MTFRCHVERPKGDETSLWMFSWKIPPLAALGRNDSVSKPSIWHHSVNLHIHSYEIISAVSFSEPKTSQWSTHVQRRRKNGRKTCVANRKASLWTVFVQRRRVFGQKACFANIYRGLWCIFVQRRMEICWKTCVAIVGSFLGSFLMELYYNDKGASQALKAAVGSFLGFITGTGLKTIVSVILMWKIIVFAFWVSWIDS